MWVIRFGINIGELDRELGRDTVVMSKATTFERNVQSLWHVGIGSEGVVMGKVGDAMVDIECGMSIVDGTIE